ncbi:MAG: hypothetical protein WBI20_11710 [Burkholderiaceae bacterium]
MATQSPFPFLDQALQKLNTHFQPPDWAVDEVQRRIVLLINHVLMQENEAMQRLARQKGRVVLFQWRSFTLKLMATPAGLLDRAQTQAQPELSLEVSEESPAALVEGLLRGEKPAVRIAGDVQLAAEVNWLIDHVRWDLEEDLAGLLGDVPAHALCQAARRGFSALRQFMGSAKPDGSGGTKP